MTDWIRQVARPPAGMSVAETARRAGISRSTLNRLMAEEVEPTLGTLRELAIVHGLDIAMSLVPLSDPDAARAARALLEGGEDEMGTPVARWVDRFTRITDDPIALLSAAGRASSLLHRRGAVGLRGGSGAMRLASAGDAAGGFWALSGGAAASLGRDQPIRGPSVLWVDDVDAVGTLLLDTHTSTKSPASAHVIVVEANASITVDTFVVDRVRYVAPIQMLLDAIGLGGTLEQWAMGEAEEWSR